MTLGGLAVPGRLGYGVVVTQAVAYGLPDASGDR